MNEELREKIRQQLLESYSVDIDEAVCKYSTHNYAFIFKDKPFMIRVSMTPRNSRKEILSELLWIDDLKSYKETICEPSLSENGKLIEEFNIDGIDYKASMFRTARGSNVQVSELTPMHFICVGELLGTIHNASDEQQRLGFHYTRKSLDERFQEKIDKTYDKLEAPLRNKVDQMRETLKTLPKDSKNYGLCHGDFHKDNFFIESNNIWLFDFDDCLYAPYLYDIASFLVACMLSGYKGDEDVRKVIYEDILPYFKIGYGLKKETDEAFWKDLELLIDYRFLYSALALQEFEDCGITEDFQAIKNYYNTVAAAPNSLDKVNALKFAL